MPWKWCGARIANIGTMTADATESKMGLCVNTHEKTIFAATEKGKTMENEVKCPECGGEPEVLYVNKAGEIVGCEFCLKAKYWFEVEV